MVRRVDYYNWRNSLDYRMCSFVFSFQGFGEWTSLIAERDRVEFLSGLTSGGKK